MPARAPSASSGSPTTSSTVWIGGGTGGGKSTLARALAVRHGLRCFPIDAFWYAYLGDRSPKTPDEQWLETPPEVQADEFERDSRRMHEAALLDLAATPMPTVVEGPQVQPELIPAGDSAVFLDPTPAWQRAVLEPRPMPSSDPARALAHRLIKDRIYADRVIGRARAFGFPVLVNDGTRSLVEEAESLLPIPSGPIDLAAARRWENEVGARNRRAWIASGDHRISTDVAFTWVCECGARGCDATFTQTLAEYDAGSVRTAH
jgi:hypothetical protein